LISSYFGIEELVKLYNLSNALGPSLKIKDINEPRYPGLQSGYKSTMKLLLEKDTAIDLGDRALSFSSFFSS
jgi:hypothetical protein